jgi:hypothetical protein
MSTGDETIPTNTRMNGRIFQPGQKLGHGKKRPKVLFTNDNSTIVQQEPVESPPQNQPHQLLYANEQQNLRL